MSPDEFKALIPQLSDSEIVSQVILAGSAVHVSESNITYLIRRIAESFGVNKEEVRLHIVGSAKLGFSLSEKRKRDGRTLPRYRPFCDKSDIDVAIVCTSIFSMLWADLSAYAYRKARIMPWDSRKLGHYLVHGWLRPDHFPGVRLPRCDLWKDTFMSFSSDRRFNWRSVRGGLFYSEADMVSYYSRSVRECRLAMELTK
jgi:hypothetical protein